MRASKICVCGTLCAYGEVLLPSQSSHSGFGRCVSWTGPAFDDPVDHSIAIFEDKKKTCPLARVVRLEEHYPYCLFTSCPP